MSKANSERFPWFKMFHWVRHKLGKQGDLKTFAQEVWLPGYRAWVRKDRFSFFLPWLVPRTRPSFPRHHLTCVQTISCGVPADLEKSCCCLVAQLCLTLCQPMDCSLPGSSVHGILQARILENTGYWNGLLCPPSGDLPDPGIEPASPALGGRFFTTEPPRKPCSLIL